MSKLLLADYLCIRIILLNSTEFHWNISWINLDPMRIKVRHDSLCKNVS